MQVLWFLLSLKGDNFIC